MNFKMGIPRIDNPWKAKKRPLKNRGNFTKSTFFLRFGIFFIIFHIGVSIILIVGLTSRIDNVNNAQKTHELTTAKKDPVHLQMAVSQLKVLPIQELFPSRNCTAYPTCIIYTYPLQIPGKMCVPFSVS